jgi:hypothetical protein
LEGDWEGLSEKEDDSRPLTIDNQTGAQFPEPPSTQPANKKDWQNPTPATSQAPLLVVGDFDADNRSTVNHRIGRCSHFALSLLVVAQRLTPILSFARD